MQNLAGVFNTGKTAVKSRDKTMHSSSRFTSVEA